MCLARKFPDKEDAHKSPTKRFSSGSILPSRSGDDDEMQEEEEPGLGPTETDMEVENNFTSDFLPPVCSRSFLGSNVSS